MARHSLFLLAVATCLSLPSGVRAQLTADEFNQFNKLLTEPDTKAAFDKRLRLIEGAIEREGEDKKPPVYTIAVDLKRARTPADQGMPVLLKRLDHSSETVRQT